MFKKFRGRFKYADWGKVSTELHLNGSGLWSQRRIKDEWNDNPLFFFKEGDDDGNGYTIIDGKWNKKE